MSSRSLLLIELCKEHGFTSGAELGVQRGNNLAQVLQGVPELKMVGVDTWLEKQDRFTYCNDPSLDINNFEVWHTFEDAERVCRPYSDRVRLVRESTTKAVSQFKDGEFDFIFIDASHQYEDVKRDIIDWSPKVRIGGYIVGHDFNMPGVREAVQETKPPFIDVVKVGADNCWMYRKNF
jgi:hypothetical protein